MNAREVSSENISHFRSNAYGTQAIAFNLNKVMCRVNRFLGCIALETFGLFLGWFSMISLIIVAFISILGIVVCIVEKSLFAEVRSVLVITKEFSQMESEFHFVSLL